MQDATQIQRHIHRLHAIDIEEEVGGHINICLLNLTSGKEVWSGGGGEERTTLAADTLNDTELFLGKYAISNRWMRSVSGGSQYVTDDVTGAGCEWVARWQWVETYTECRPHWQRASKLKEKK